MKVGPLPGKATSTVAESIHEAEGTYVSVVKPDSSQPRAGLSTAYQIPDQAEYDQQAGESQKYYSTQLNRIPHVIKKPPVAKIRTNDVLA